MTNFLRLYHTVRHLRPVQVLGRLQHRVYHPPAAERPRASSARCAGRWVSPAEKPPRQTGPTTFQLLNQTVEAASPAAWQNPHLDPLTRYHLHSFDDLAAAGSADRRHWHRSLLERWIDENPAADGCGWHPYPVSLRIVNWIKWSLAGNELSEAMRHSLAVQARWLRRRLEYHLLGNHLLANAKTLVFAGLFFAEEEADRWLDIGLDILERQLPEQFLADGGHFELSPMYHSLMLEDLLDLVNAAYRWMAAAPRITAHLPQWIEIIQRARHWLLAMCHEDGQIGLFNDAAFGIAPAPDQLEAYARRLGLPAVAAPGEGITHLAQSGYLRLAQQGTLALLDVGRVGPDYLPGHAHADTLSFELSLGQQRLLVDSGTSTYWDDEQRGRQRSTAAHNTVEVAGFSSSEVWSRFRVARRAYPLDLHIEEHPDRLIVTCAHDGYRRLSPPVIHRRRWQLQPGGLQIVDRLEGDAPQGLARLHLHPDLDIRHSTAKLSTFRTAAASIEIEHPQCSLEASTWHPEFGRSEFNQRLVIPIEGSEDSHTKITWQRTA